MRYFYLKSASQIQRMTHADPFNCTELTVMTDDTTVYKYTFTLAEGETKEIRLCLDKTTSAVICPPVPVESLPSWTLLEYQQCPNCPLNAKLHTHCPIAVNIASLANDFSSFTSYHKAKVSVETESRIFVKETDIQTALSSILGIYMATSGCAIMDKLRPMVRFHLPFATALETQYRAISMYLAAQYLRYKQGKIPDWELKGFVEMYDDVNTVNMAFSKRLRKLEQSDANQNALVILANFATLINFNVQLDEQIPSELETIFKPFTDLP